MVFTLGFNGVSVSVASLSMEWKSSIKFSVCVFLKNSLVGSLVCSLVMMYLHGGHTWCSLWVSVVFNSVSVAGLSMEWKSNIKLSVCVS